MKQIDCFLPYIDESQYNKLQKAFEDVSAFVTLHALKDLSLIHISEPTRPY